MQTVIIRKYSTFFDPVTNTQFNPILDRSAGVYIGVAQIDDSLVQHFSSNPAYTLLTVDQYSALVTGQSSTNSSALGERIRADVEQLQKDVLPDAPKAP